MNELQVRPEKEETIFLKYDKASPHTRILKGEIFSEFR
jgi:hypothetical protein